MIVAGIKPVGANSTANLFDSIVFKHQAGASEYRVVTQPDHANLSGEFSALIDRKKLPWVTDEIVEGIRAHDAGWLGIDGAAPNPILPPFESDGRLRSFLTTPPEIFLQAWTRSITNAERIGNSAGTMVSRHFEHLAQFRLQSSPDKPEEVASLRGFVAQESSRQRRMHRGAAHSEERLKLLQFCDFLSLFFCCGLESALTFPMEFGFGAVRLEPGTGGAKLSGIPMTGALEAECPAYSWRPGSSLLVSDPIRCTVRMS